MTAKLTSLDLLKKWLEITSLLVVIFGVPTFFYQQWQDAEIRRREQTLRFIATYQDQRVAAARADLLLPWTAYAAEIQFLNSSGGIDRSMLNQWVNKVIDASVEKNPKENLLHSIYIVTDFFDQLYLCLNIGVCQEKPATAYFQSDALDFFCLYGHKIDQIQESLSAKDFGAGLRYFSATSAHSCAR